GWNAEKEQLESELAAAKRRKPPRIEVPPVPPTRSIEERSGSPDEIIEVLKHARIGTGLERIPSARRLIYQFEALADFGDPAIAAIREYLARFEDVDYPFELDATADVAGAGVIPAAILPPGSKSQPGAAEARLDFIVPPS